jgi:hypothetical protein
MKELEDLVAAYRVLAEYGVIDAYGHVSMRSPRARRWSTASPPSCPATVRCRWRR